MRKTSLDRAISSGRFVVLAAAIASVVLAISAIGSGCASAVYQDNSPEVTVPTDASTDAPVDAASDVSTDGAPVYSGPIGNPCANNAECGDGYRCQLTAPGGYCVMDCPSGVVCPEGTLCSPIPMSRITGVCMKACINKAECRPGYDCAVVSLFQGDPAAPKSPGPVCWEAWPPDAGP